VTEVARLARPTYLIVTDWRASGIRLAYDRHSIGLLVGPKNRITPEVTDLIRRRRQALLNIVRWEFTHGTTIEQQVQPEESDLVLWLHGFDGSVIPPGWEVSPGETIVDGDLYARTLVRDLDTGPAWFVWDTALAKVRKLRGAFG